MSKVRFSRADALCVARELNMLMEGHCERKIFAGSLRRRKPDVGDIEMLYIPRNGELKNDDLFETTTTANLTELRIQWLLDTNFLTMRPNVNGGTAWGAKNKLAIHVASGIPVDLFAASEINWWNYLVCRTGGAENNVAIASAAQKKGWTWNPYGAGFSKQKEALCKTTIDLHIVGSEREVFDFVKMPYLEPWERK